VEEARTAERVGALLAEAGAILISGGLGGVMSASCKGAAGRGGQTIGLLPGWDRTDGNPYLTVSLPTGLHELRNGLVIGTSDGAIAIGGGWGTLSEVALAMRTGKPLVAIRSWVVTSPEGPQQALSVVDTPEEAVREVLSAIKAKPQ
jgi:uncharacterized protein (TIGR00725 family)